MTLNILLQYPTAQTDLPAVREALVPLLVSMGEPGWVDVSGVRPGELHTPPLGDLWWEHFIEQQDATGSAIRRELETTVLPWIDSVGDLDKLSAWCASLMAHWLGEVDSRR